MERVCLVSLATILLVSLTSISCGNGATAPAAPTGLTCQWVSSSQIDLSWDASSRADGYNVYRCTGASCTPTTQIHAESTTSWSDTGLASSTTYCYRLTAYNEVGESGYGAIVSCTTYNPQVAWNKTFGGSLHDSGHSVQQTPDGGYIIAASTYFPGGESDFWLIKTDSAGNEEWNKTFGGADTDFCYSGQLTSDGGYIMTGYTDSYGAGNSDVWLIKTDSSGNVAWNRTFDDSIQGSYGSVQQTSDGGYIFVGDTLSGSCERALLLKTDSSGNIEWDMTFASAYNDGTYKSVQQTSDGGYIIAGYAGFPSDVWLVKVTV